MSVARYLGIKAEQTHQAPASTELPSKAALAAASGLPGGHVFRPPARMLEPPVQAPEPKDPS
ncbi:hypothetical protein [Methylibium sp.]|uniref:hypothetical protein n=1 Tax=Methylibium sp. TaxID=2067992 RepID=UPI003D12DB31